MMSAMRDIVRIDEELCDGCGLCVSGCAEGAIEIRDDKARLVAKSTATDWGPAWANAQGRTGGTEGRTGGTGE